MMVRDFHRVREEARKQILEREERLPDYLVACVGGGSNAMGLFHPFLADESVKLLVLKRVGAELARGTCSKISGRKTRCITRDKDMAFVR